MPLSTAGRGPFNSGKKDLEGRALHVLAEQLRALTLRYRARLLINDRLDVALAVEADGVHLGHNSFAVEDARRLLGAGKLIGVSTHSQREITEAQGADFIVFGPVYYTPSKAAYGEPQGLDRLRAAVTHSTTPVFAIGGIKTGRVAEVLETGAHGIAMISAISAAPRPHSGRARVIAAARLRCIGLAPRFASLVESPQSTPP